MTVQSTVAAHSATTYRGKSLPKRTKIYKWSVRLLSHSEIKRPPDSPLTSILAIICPLFVGMDKSWRQTQELSTSVLKNLELKQSNSRKQQFTHTWAIKQTGNFYVTFSALINNGFNGFHAYLPLPSTSITMIFPVRKNHKLSPKF